MSWPKEYTEFFILARIMSTAIFIPLAVAVKSQKMNSTAAIAKMLNRDSHSWLGKVKRAQHVFY
jgi:hypothetical protein